MSISCSVKECKARKKEVDNMSLKELTHYNTKCCNCGEWIFKGEGEENKIASETYMKVSVMWAEKMMDKAIRRN